ncbi:MULTISPECIES: class I SAM-dependent methyltransferase [unclassified Nocardia]|uniref:class I SAM-dependent methyltransferase n=1 Tax=unclassified Nocardia TaxID=2637762 RepID=UPI00278BB450|nr:MULTISPECIES: methyltransferase domain-containing protein [unclassified Nocardia]
MAGFAKQLALPSGRVGLAVMRLLNVANRKLMDGSVDAVSAAPGQRVADIGFGGGHGLRRLLGQVGPTGIVHGVDLSADAIAQAQKTFRNKIRDGRLTLHHTSMDALPFDDKSLAGVVTVNTVYYIEDEPLAASLAEVARVLEPGGRLVIGAADPAYQAGLPFRDGMISRTPEQIQGFMEAAGFSVTDHRRVGDSDRAFHVYVGTR